MLTNKGGIDTYIIKLVGIITLYPSGNIANIFKNEWKLNGDIIGNREEKVENENIKEVL